MTFQSYGTEPFLIDKDKYYTYEYTEQGNLKFRKKYMKK